MTGALRDRPVALPVPAPQRVFDGVRPVDRYRLALPGASGLHEREVLVARRVVAIIPYDPRADEVVLIRQFRLSAHLRTGDGDLIEVPAGGIDPGEDEAAAARRELAEETGLGAARLHAGPRVMPTPGASDEIYRLFVAEVDATAAAAGAGLAHEGEVIRPVAVPALEAIRAARAGAFVNGYALLALLWFAGARPSLRRRWARSAGSR